jgi:hypothetical protein
MCCGDSDLVAQQVAGTYKARKEVMAAYKDEVDEMSKSFLSYDIKHVRREDNMAAGTLSKLGSSRKAVPPGIFLEHLHVPSVKMVDPENPELASSLVMVVLPCNQPWAKPYLEYLMTKELPEDEVQKRQIEHRAKAYTIIDGQLYKRSTSGVFMKCISQVDGIEILREIHEGECGHHAAARSLVAKAFRHGFYWPTAKANAPHRGALPRLPDVLQANPHACHSTTYDPYNLAFHGLGAGHGGFAENSTFGIYAPTGSGRQIHEVGRS